MSSTALPSLRSILARLYYRKPDIETMVEDLDLDPGQIAWDERPVNTWRSILQEVDRAGTIDVLLDLAKKRYPADDQLLRFVEAHPETDWRRELYAQSPFLVPFLQNQDFVGRQEDLEQLHQALSREDPVGIRPAGLTGLGGIGKTELAVEYSYRYCDLYPGGVFWVNAAELWTQGFADLGRSLQPSLSTATQDQQIRAVADHLRAHPDSLLVLDNVADPALLRRPVTLDLTPAGLPCRVLFTTRRRDLGDFQPIEVSVLPEKPGLRLLLRRPERQAALAEDHSEYPDARAVYRLLAGLPLALEIAGAFLGEWPQVSLADFRARLRQDGVLATVDEEAGELPQASLRGIHAAAVEATLGEQWKGLDTERRADQDARLLLRIAGQLPEAAQIPAARLGLLAGMDDDAKPGRPSRLQRALRRLEALSLVEELREDSVRLHPLVREFAARRTPADEVAQFRAQCASALAAAYEDAATLEAHLARRRVVAVEGDVVVALGLVQDGVESSTPPEATRAFLQALRGLLQREAHTLVHADADSPTFITQQVLKRAVISEAPGLEKLTADARRRLQYVGRAHLALRWASLSAPPAWERTLAGHKGYVTSVAVTPDGQRAISASHDDTLKVWNLDSGQEERTLAGHEGWVNAVAVTADGRRALSASTDRTLKVWNLDSGEAEQTLAGHYFGVIAVAVTPDGRRAVSGSLDLKVWNLDTGQEERTLSGHKDPVEAIAVTFDGRRAVSASRDRTLRVWNLDSGQTERTLVGHDDSVEGVAVTPDGRRAVSASKDRTLKVWNLDSGQLERTLVGHAKGVRGVAVTPDGRRAVSASEDDTLKVWNLLSGQVEHTFAGHQEGVAAVAVTPNGRCVVSASDDRTLKVWSLDSGTQDVGLKQSGLGHRGSVSAVAVIPNGRRAISASYDRTLKVWNLETGQVEQTFAGHEDWVRAVAVTPDGRRAVSASQDRALKIWNLETGEAEHTLAGHEDTVWAVVVTLDSRRAISASSDLTLKVWNLDNGEEEHTLAGHEDTIYDMVVTPDGRRAISASRDRTLKVWNLDSGQVEQTLAGHDHWVDAVAMTPDGRRAISASTDNTLKVWNLDSGRAEQTLPGHKDRVFALATATDGRRVVSAALNDSSLKVWNPDAGQEEHTLVGHEHSVTAVAVTSDGRRAASASWDRTLKVWNLDTGQEICSITLEAGPSRVALVPVALEPTTNHVTKGFTIITGDAAGNVYCFDFFEPSPLPDPQ